jgi:hypothetical protein
VTVISAGLVLLDLTIMGREPRRRSLEASTAAVRAVPVSSRPTDRRASRDDLITLPPWSLSEALFGPIPIRHPLR